MVFGIFHNLINGIAWYCIVLYCVVGFGARAVSRKTPIYFIVLILRRKKVLFYGIADIHRVFLISTEEGGVEDDGGDVNEVICL